MALECEQPSGPPIAGPARPLRRLLAWGVHAYTALGLVAAAGIAVLVVRGGADSFRWAFALMVVATLVDATDGILAQTRLLKEDLVKMQKKLGRETIATKTKYTHELVEI